MQKTRHDVDSPQGEQHNDPKTVYVQMIYTLQRTGRIGLL